MTRIIHIAPGKLFDDDEKASYYPVIPRGCLVGRDGLWAVLATWASGQSEVIQLTNVGSSSGAPGNC